MTSTENESYLVGAAAGVEGAADPAKDAMMKTRMQQLVVRGVAAGGLNVGYAMGIDGAPARAANLAPPFIKGAVAVVGADFATDWLIQDASWAKAIRHRLPEVVLSEPVLSGLIQYAYAYWMARRGSNAGLTLQPNFILEFALGALGSEVSHQAVSMWSA